MGLSRVSGKGGKDGGNLGGFLKLRNFPIWLFCKPNRFPKVTPQPHPQKRKAF